MQAHRRAAIECACVGVCVSCVFYVTLLCLVLFVPALLFTILCPGTRPSVV